jgi:hypothetical protein
MKNLGVSNLVLTIENLYRSRTIMELFKIIKYRTPMSLYSLLNVSNRKSTLMITPSPTKNFIYKSTYYWNTFRKLLGNLDFTSPFSSIKSLLNKSLLSSQSKYGADWCDKNFIEFWEHCLPTLHNVSVHMSKLNATLCFTKSHWHAHYKNDLTQPSWISYCWHSDDCKLL